ncbi:mitogen-activated protein kinase kinase kinase 2 [Phtheirospermum japonicum]|uniref:Mitogen-activated protein kinase kinase kinase 2 n=1 Tax=Phtheirospermum japonicum TaxID=374723 RepID=A0A830BJ39_9LAMI|nr:mitogen-activated protein kinase kinase kinase 2 [Phtheirospermum japonicum]
MRRNNDVVNEYGDGIQWTRGSILGKGSFGRVYKATLKNSRSKYSYFPSEMAVKSAEVSVSSTLQKEREIMNNLDGSPYVITCFGEETTIGDKGMMAYNVLLEFASGGTLADRIKKLSGLPEHEVRAHTRSILRGLNGIHGLGYVHCDLKPDNILLAKIGDLGLAKREIKQSNKKRKIMESNYWRGTPMYLSPETVIDYVQAAPSDVWAVGCIVLEMLTGKPAWDEFNAEDILARIGAAKELPKIPDDISREARDFLKCCFVTNSIFRFTCDMLLNHPTLQGLGDDVEELEDSESYIAGISDDECSSELFSDESEEDSFCSLSDDELVSGLAEAQVVAAQHFNGSNEIMSKQMPSQLRVYKRRHHQPVCLNIPLQI